MVKKDARFSKLWDRGRQAFPVSEIEQCADIAKKEMEKKTTPGWRFRSAYIQLFYEAATAFLVSRSYSSVPSFLDSASSAIIDDRNARSGFLKFCLWAIPTIGFIGTVVGIGAALLETMNVDAINVIERSIAKSSVSTNIGVAFDTTLVALLLSLIGMLGFNLVSQFEEVEVLSALNSVKRSFRVQNQAAEPNVVGQILTRAVEKTAVEINRATRLTKRLEIQTREANTAKLKPITISILIVTIVNFAALLVLAFFVIDRLLLK